MTPATDTTSTTHCLLVGDIGPVEVTVSEQGHGRPLLLLHGGAGPQSVTGFAELLAENQAVRVITPTHPGFGGTTRPESLSSPARLAALYAELLDRLDLHDVIVVGNSIGGWIAAEMALLGSSRIGAIVLVGAVGIEVEGHPVADFFSLTMDQVAELSYYDPDSFRIDLSTLPPAQQQLMVGNRATLAAYAGAQMVDTTLRTRLAAVYHPTLVLSGESDRIVDQEYGRAFADSIPGAKFQVLPRTGHMPQIETPQQLMAAIMEFAPANVLERRPR
jgi:pimeloyl-ACP methyl ester carboxylesterase